MNGARLFDLTPGFPSKRFFTLLNGEREREKWLSVMQSFFTPIDTCVEDCDVETSVGFPSLVGMQSWKFK